MARVANGWEATGQEAIGAELRQSSFEAGAIRREIGQIRIGLPVSQKRNPWAFGCVKGISQQE
jgi:hypothetical protein